MRCKADKRLEERVEFYRGKGKGEGWLASYRRGWSALDAPRRVSG